MGGGLLCKGYVTIPAAFLVFQRTLPVFDASISMCHVMSVEINHAVFPLVGNYRTHNWVIDPSHGVPAGLVPSCGNQVKIIRLDQELNMRQQWFLDRLQF